MKKNILRKGIATAVALVLSLSVMVPASFAYAPAKESVKYKGNGVVEVDFRSDVRYKDSKVTVKDEEGNRYEVRVIERDDDEIKFKVKNFKVGQKYTFKISGIKKVRTNSYGTVKGTFTIKKTIGKAKAKEIAIKHFVNKLGIAKSKIAEIDVEYQGAKNRYEVSIETVRDVEYQYYIGAKSGKIIKVIKDVD